MKTFFSVSIILIFISISVNGQVVSKDLLLQEKLINLALENSEELYISKLENKIYKEGLVQTRWDWLDLITITGNLNEGNFQTQEQMQNSFFPRYNFSARLNLGSFVDIPSKKRQAALALQISNKTSELVREDIIKNTLSTYYQFISAQEILRNKMEIFTFFTERLKLAKDDFKVEKITIEEYNKIQSEYNSIFEDKINAEANYLIKKAELEYLIGTEFENI